MFVSMTTRTSRKTLTFSGPFSLKGVDQKLPAGDYRVVTDEELIELAVFMALADFDSPALCRRTDFHVIQVEGIDHSCRRRF